MRRISVLLSVVGVVVLSVAGMLRQPTVLAQKATPAVGEAAVPPLVQQFVDAINAADSAAIAALYTEDGSHEDIPAGVRVQGQDEIVAFVEGVFGQFGDVRITPTAARQEGDLAVLEYDFSVVELQSGQPVRYQGVIILVLEGERIRRSADYYDNATILEQLGLLALADAGAAATPAP